MLHPSSIRLTLHFAIYLSIYQVRVLDWYHGKDIHGYSGNGGGKVWLSDVGSTWEYFEIIDHPDGTFSFKCTAFDNVYLRLWAGGRDGSEYVNLQYGSGELEKFLIKPAIVRTKEGTYKGSSIESVRFPSNFLSFAGGEGRRSVGVATAVREWEVVQFVDLPRELNATELKATINKFGPQLRFEPRDRFRMCTVEYFLQHSTLRWPGGEKRSPTVDELPTNTTKSDSGLWIDENALNGDLKDAKAYVRAWKPELSTYTDIQFNFCYANNGPGFAWIEDEANNFFSTDPLGNHFGDWEMCMLRYNLVDRNLVGAWLSQHDKGRYCNQFDIKHWAKSPLSDGPVVYASWNGHGVYPRAGYLIYADFDVTPPIIERPKIRGGLVNITGSGPTLDCATKFELISTSWLKGADAIKEPHWVKYRGRWGPFGQPQSKDGELKKTIIKIVEDNFIDNDWIAKKVADTILDIAVSKLGDNPDGPEGPATKDMWDGKY